MSTRQETPPLWQFVVTVIVLAVAVNLLADTIFVLLPEGILVYGLDKPSLVLVVSVTVSGMAIYLVYRYRKRQLLAARLTWIRLGGRLIFAISFSVIEIWDRLFDLIEKYAPESNLGKLLASDEIGRYEDIIIKSKFKPEYASAVEVVLEKGTEAEREGLREIIVNCVREVRNVVDFGVLFIPTEIVAAFPDMERCVWDWHLLGGVDAGELASVLPVFLTEGQAMVGLLRESGIPIELAYRSGRRVRI